MKYIFLVVLALVTSMLVLESLFILQRWGKAYINYWRGRDGKDEAPPPPAQIATSEKITAVRASPGGCSLEHIRTKPLGKAPPTAAEVARMSTAEKVAWMRSGMRKPYIPGKTDGDTK